MSNWGPWINHDGKGCPVRGQLVEGLDRGGIWSVWIAGTVYMIPTNASQIMVDSWIWPTQYSPHADEILRYRVRKPKAMERLNEILREVEDNPKVELIVG